MTLAKFKGLRHSETSKRVHEQESEAQQMCAISPPECK